MYLRLLSNLCLSKRPIHQSMQKDGKDTYSRPGRPETEKKPGNTGRLQRFFYVIFKFIERPNSPGKVFRKYGLP